MISQGNSNNLGEFFGFTLIQNSSTKNQYKSYFKIGGRRYGLHGTPMHAAERAAVHSCTPFCSARAPVWADQV
jgi:hypothetical protein